MNTQDIILLAALFQTTPPDGRVSMISFCICLHLRCRWKRCLQVKLTIYCSLLVKLRNAKNKLLSLCLFHFGRLYLIYTHSHKSIHTKVITHAHTQLFLTIVCDFCNRWRDKQNSSKGTTLKLGVQWCIIHCWSNLTGSYLPVWDLLWNNAASFKAASSLAALWVQAF